MQIFVRGMPRILSLLWVAGVGCAGTSTPTANQAGEGGSSSTLPSSPDSSTLPNSPSGESPPVLGAPVPFSPISARAAAAKVKNMLTGAALTDAEAASAATAQGLDQLISTWQQSPRFQQKYLAFLSNAFQQSQVVFSDFDSLGVPIDPRTMNRSTTITAELVQNLQQIYARTVMYLDNQGKPLTDALTTRSFMMTSALKTYYAYLDHIDYDDNDVLVNHNGGALASTMIGFANTKFSDWQWTTIRAPNGGESTTAYTNAAQANELVLTRPWIGFLTPAFFAGYATNSSNAFRVTLNQSMIVALGQTMDGTHNDSVPAALSASASAWLDSSHSANPACAGCHVSMDPARGMLYNTLTTHFSLQKDANLATPGVLAWDGLSASGHLTNFVQALTTSTALAPAWAQKVVTYLNSSPAVSNDPALISLAQGFVASNYSLKKLFAQAASSPLVLYNTQTVTASHVPGEVFPIMKSDDLCPMLEARLGLTDPCGLNPTTTLDTKGVAIHASALSLPSNGYSRGSVAPLEAVSPTMFYIGAVNNIMSLIAQNPAVIGPGALFDPANATKAVNGMVTTFLGISDPNVSSLLQAHYQQAVAQGASPATALQSTFVVAGTSLYFVGNLNP